MTVNYPLVLISGHITGSDDIDAINVVRDEIFLRWPVINCNFKCLIPLKEGRNSLRFDTGHLHPLSFNTEIVYRPHSENQRIVRILYIVCRDEWGRIFERGSFQSLPEEDNSLGSAKAKISLAVQMLQTFFGETTPSHFSFRVELNPDGTPKVHAFTIEKTQSELWTLGQQELWDLVAESILSSKLADRNCKYLAFCSFSRYICDQFVDSSTSNAELRKMAKGYVALGGGGLALLSTLSLFSWPNDVDQVLGCFTDERQVDRTLLMDESGSRGTFAGCYSNTLGACAHELGHVLDLGHASYGIMSPFYADIEKFFILSKNPSEPPVKWWTRSSSLILAHHKWCNAHGESLEDSFRITDSTLRSRYGIVVIEYRKQSGFVNRFNEFFLPAKWVKLQIHAEDCALIAMDTRGNIFRKDLSKSMPSNYARSHQEIESRFQKAICYNFQE